ncbi:MAG TPA: HIT domain-containing protein [Micromonosporaceae bacterium]|jgi:histidine triad (HIT) family protein
MTDPDCIFCKIAAGDIPSIQVASDERTIAFMDIAPATRGHLLVIPRRHYPDLLTVDDDDLTAVTLMARRMAALVVGKLDADGVNLLNACGSAAWQTVFHFHMHVIPRYRDDPARDALKLPWIPTPGDMDDIAAAAEELST